MTMDDNKTLLKFLQRRHPQYESMESHWRFLEETYRGGRDWFKQNIFQYIKEGNSEYADRVERAYRFNHSREVVDLVDKYLFKMEIGRQEEGASESLKSFWKSASFNGRSINDFMKRLSNRASVFGRVWVVIDSTRADGEIRTKRDEKNANLRRYAYVLTPLDVLDMGYDASGMLNWMLVKEQHRDDDDPISSSGEVSDRYRLWTKTETRVFVMKKIERKITVEELEALRYKHDLGLVPIVPVDTVMSEDLYTSPALITDVAYLDRGVANYLSNVDAIIQDQTFSQLIMPAGSASETEEDSEGEGKDKLKEVGTSRIFTYDADAGGEPKFISPDVKQAEIILKTINKIINEIYHSIGLAGERTKEDNALGIDNSSGVAKAYDFERVNSLLAAKADSLEMAETRIAKIVQVWAGDAKADSDLSEDVVDYPDNFDVRGLYDEFEIAARLGLVDAPDTVKREQMKSLIAKLFPQLTEEKKSEIEKELKDWPIDIEELMKEAAQGSAQPQGSKGAEAVKKVSTNLLANKVAA